MGPVRSAPIVQAITCGRFYTNSAQTNLSGIVGTHARYLQSMIDKLRCLGALRRFGRCSLGHCFLVRSGHVASQYVNCANT